MSGFAEAVKQGLNAHQRALEARDEIDSVLQEASQDISAVLTEPIQLSIETLPLSAIYGLLGIKTDRSSLGLTARRENRIEALAEVKFADPGYPVRLRYEDLVDSATNRDEFAAILRALLRHRSVGEKLASLAK